MKSNRVTLIIGTLFGMMFLLTVDYQFLIPLLPTLSREWDVPIETLGWLFSAYALSAALFNLVVAPLSDRYGRILFLRIGLAAFALVALLSYQTASYRQLFWLRTATGLTSGLLSACISGFIGDFFPYSKRGRVMGIVLSAYFVAFILGIPLAAWVAERWDWRGVFFCSMLLALPLLACLFFFPKERPSSQALGVKSYLSVYPRLVSTPRTGAAVAVSFVISGGTLAFLTFISGYLDETFGLKPVEISWVFLTVGMAAAVASPFAGWTADRLGKRQVFLAANTLMVIPLLALNQLSWGAPMIGLFFLISLCVGFRQTALQALQSELVEQERRGSFLALRNSFSQLGISISVLVAGTLYSKAGYGAVTILAALLTLAGSALLYRAIQEPGESR